MRTSKHGATALLVAIGILGTLSTQVSATTLYGGNSLRFFSVDDLATGSMTSIDFISDFSIGGLAFDPDSGILYGGNSTGRFFRVDDLSDGSSTSISTGGFAVDALAFDPVSGTLYGGNAPGGFFRIDDLSNGSSTFIASGVNGFGIEALAFDPVSGILYGGNASGRFFRVDDLSNSSSTSISTGGFAIEALAFDPVSGILYGGNSSRFFSIDPTDGSMTNVDYPSDFEIHGLSFQPVPEPGSLFLSSFGALSVVGFGWRRTRKLTNRQPPSSLRHR